jgi:hypothetical protein
MNKLKPYLFNRHKVTEHTDRGQGDVFNTHTQSHRTLIILILPTATSKL